MYMRFVESISPSYIVPVGMGGWVRWKNAQAEALGPVRKTWVGGGKAGNISGVEGDP